MIESSLFHYMQPYPARFNAKRSASAGRTHGGHRRTDPGRQLLQALVLGSFFGSTGGWYGVPGAAWGEAKSGFGSEGVLHERNKFRL